MQFLALATVAAAPVPPPSPIVAAPPPFTIARPPAAIEMLEPGDVQVEVSADDRTLWQGSLRVVPNQGADFTQSVNQGIIARAGCEQRGGTSRSSLTVALNRGYRTANRPGALQVTVNWLRDLPSVACGAPDAPNRTAALTETVFLEEGKTVRIVADAGLVVKITPITR